MRVIWVTSLMFFLSGCSGYKTVCTTDNEPGFVTTCPLEPGDKVRITLKDGDRISGEVRSLSDRAIVLADDPEAGNPRFVPVANILSVEKETSYRKQKAVGLVLVLGAVVVAGVIIANNTKSPEIKPLDLDIMK
jgi:hypothetical protein